MDIANIRKIIEKINWKKVAAAIVYIVLAVILVFSVGIWMFNILMGRIVHNRTEVIVPDIEGKTINDALTILSKKNLSLFKVAEKFDTEVPAGSIISQSPPPGLTVREGKGVEAVVSSGGKVVFVPAVEGRTLRQAELLLRQAGLLMGEQVRTFSNNISADHIVSQEPAVGEVVEKNSYVNIVVSRGPAEEEKIKKMPNLLARRIEKAEQLLKELGLELTNIETIVNDDLSEGTVVEQSPKQGTIVDENSKIELTISKQTRSLKEVREATVYYEVVQSGVEKNIKIVLEDDIGERVVYEGRNMGGTKIEVPVKVLGVAQVKIYIDEILVKEEELEW
jgi:serine/threonine-protein kinase